MRIICLTILQLAFICLVSACTPTPQQKEDIYYTLYRNVPSDESFRVSVATFNHQNTGDLFDDTDELINKKNCERVATYYQKDLDWKGVKFWCEKGIYKK